jgi:hypothetical protein
VAELPGYSSPTGCVPLSIPITNISWIALVVRGECSFTEKIRTMQQSGAAAVIVGDNQYRQELIVMNGEGNLEGITIPSVFVSRWSYNYLYMQSSPALIIRLEPNGYSSFFPDSYSIVVLFPVIVVLLSYVYQSTANLYHRFIRRRQMRRALDSLDTETFQMTKEQELEPDVCVSVQMYFHMLGHLY